LYSAWKAFRKGKRPSKAIDEFAYDLEANLTQLSFELCSGSYKHGNYQPVVLYEKKRRDLAVATVKDRVVHRLLYDYLVDIYDNSFDPDVWSCRKGKGLHACLGRTQKLLQKYPNGFVWRADITKFYDNVNHSTLRDCLHKKIGNDSNALRVLDKVIDSYSTINGQAGIPIGNLTSQIFSNIYLHEFDRFVRHHIKPLAYVRYGDDFAVFCPTLHGAYSNRDLAVSFLRDNLALTINSKNDVVVASRAGLKFLGHNITKGFTEVDKHTTRSVLSKLDWHNAASYKAMPLPETDKRSLDWILLEKYVDV
jgi:RNA-directed DNA polymerase